jgi:phosphohistidine phosphatase SixA
MNKTFSYTLKSIVSSFLLLPAFFAVASVPSEVLSTPDLIKALQSGGHIIYMRHGETDVSQKDKTRDSFDDCSSQRNLSEVGRTEVAKIGKSIKHLKIPIGHVTSSPYCRTKDTAKLAFGDFDIDPKLQFSISKNKKEAKKLGEDLVSMMLDTQNTDKNKVFVGHTANLKDGLGVWPKPEGVMAIFKKQDGKIVFKGMVRPDEWCNE